MPWGDRRGPNGAGPMTGRGMGYCAGYDRPGYMNQDFWGRGFGRGYGRGAGFGVGRGGGWGWRNQYYATGQPGWARYGYAPVAPYSPTPAQEKEALSQAAKDLRSELKEIEKRLDELNKEKQSQ